MLRVDDSDVGGDGPSSTRSTRLRSESEDDEGG